MRKIIRSLYETSKILVLLVLITLCGFISYFIFTMTIGSTYGLQDKLKNLDNVVSVENYTTYEGSAFFTLILTNNRLIKLSLVGNEDLIKSDGMIIDQIGSYDIICKYSSGRAFNPGIPIKYIGQDHIVSKAIESVPNLIKYYENLEGLFAKMPLEFSSEPDFEATTPTMSLLCKDANP